MNIRNADLRDIPGMIELLKQVGQVHHEIRPDIFRAGAQKYDEAALAEILSDPMRPIFVAVEEDKVLGYCFCQVQVTEKNPVLNDRYCLYIDDLCVLEGCRGKHIGSALYNEVVRYAKMRKCDAITLNVWEGNDAAKAFYEKMGFAPQKTVMEKVL